MMSADASKVLLVEGKDDEQVIYQLCNANRYDNRSQFTVKPMNGYPYLHEELQILPKRSGIEVVGAVVDADLEPMLRWQSLRDALRLAGYQHTPERPNPTGTILPGGRGRPIIGLWMMPDNRRDGILEDFLKDLAHLNDDLFPLVEAAVDGIPEPQRRFETIHRSKAVIHTWLAWQADPGTPTGQALTKHYLNPQHPRALEFLAWLRNLFT